MSLVGRMSMYGGFDQARCNALPAPHMQVLPEVDGRDMMARNVLIMVLILVAALWAGCTGMSTSEQKVTHEPAEAETTRQDVLYTCSCGPQCGCSTVSIKPGKCSCGAPLKWGHVLKIEGPEVILCQCQEGCRCYGLDNREYRCNCGVAVKRVSLKDTGIYFCNCGGSCYCNTVSDTPEKCRCGMLLKKIG